MCDYTTIALSEKDIERFWSKVDKKSEDECWEWTGGRNKGGYGRLWAQNTRIYAPRISWVLHNGQIPKGNPPYGSMFVCHKCDNPGCVNPAHLFLGATLDNMRDKCKKGRAAPTNKENNGNHKLTEEQVIEIREKYIPFVYTLNMLAQEYGVVQSTIESIIYNKRWKNVERITKETGELYEI